MPAGWIHDCTLNSHTCFRSDLTSRSLESWSSGDDALIAFCWLWGPLLIM